LASGPPGSKIRVVRKFFKEIDVKKTRVVEHLYQARLGRIESNAIETLILDLRLVDKRHHWLRAWKNHAFDQEELGSEGVQVTDCKKRVFEMVEKPETEDQVKPSHAPQRRVFGIRRLEANIG